MQWYWILLIILLIIVLCTILTKIINVVTLGTCDSARKLSGKVVLVTGGSKGIGYQTALNLARRGAKVIITGSNLNDLQAAYKQLIKESANDDIVAKRLNLNTLEEVRQFCIDFLRTESKLDILINNAGTFGNEAALTGDGIVPDLQINYIGPFLLTNLLLDLLKKSGSSRIVNVGSTMANISLFFNPNDINKFSSFKISDLRQIFEYIHSKICMYISTIEMASRLEGTGIAVNYVHPGVCYTNIFQNNGRVNFLASILKYIIMKSPEQAAQTTIHAAICEKTEGVSGKYFIDCKPSKISVNLNTNIRDLIWTQTIVLCKIKPEEMIPEIRNKKMDV